MRGIESRARHRARIGRASAPVEGPARNATRTTRSAAAACVNGPGARIRSTTRPRRRSSVGIRSHSRHDLVELEARRDVFAFRQVDTLVLEPRRLDPVIVLSFSVGAGPALPAACETAGTWRAGRDPRACVPRRRSASNCLRGSRNPVSGSTECLSRSSTALMKLRQRSDSMISLTRGRRSVAVRARSR